MNRSLMNWKKLGLRSFVVLMLIGAVSGLSACGGGGGNGGDDVNTDNTGNPEDANFIDFAGGSLTIAGSDIGTGEGAPTLSRFFGTPPEGDTITRTWMTSSSSLSIQIIFHPDGTLILTNGISTPTDGVLSLIISFLDLGQETSRQYSCRSVDCTGITHDPSAKTITFNNVVVPLPISSVFNTATAPVTVNGTLKYPE